MNDNGFKVNTNIRVKPRRRKKRRIIKNSILLGTAFIFVLAVLAIIFCTTVPVKNVTILDNCVIEYKNGNTEIDYYDENGRVIKKATTEYGVENIIINYTYDKEGNILKEETSFQGMTLSSVNYVYAEGRLTRKESLTKDKKISGAVEYHYNTDGTVTMELVYNQDGNITDQYNHIYEAGVRTETTRVQLNDNFTEVFSYTYENGNLITQKQISNKGQRTTTYTYDNMGKVLTKSAAGGEYTVYRYNYKTVKVPLWGK